MSWVPQIGSKSILGGRGRIRERDPGDLGRAPTGSLQGEWIEAGKWESVTEAGGEGGNG